LELLAEALAFIGQGVALGTEVLELAEERGVVEILEELLGLSVEGLSWNEAFVGESCDVAVAAVEDSLGAGDAEVGGYAVHGVDSCG
jgi:hypothetical protein